MAGILPDWLESDEAPGSGDLLGGFGNWLGNNSSTLMGLGAGIAGGRTWGEGLSKGFQNAITGRALDQRRAVHDQTVAALMQRGLDESTARTAAGNPAPCCAPCCGSSPARVRARPMRDRP